MRSPSRAPSLRQKIPLSQTQGILLLNTAMGSLVCPCLGKEWGDSGQKSSKGLVLDTSSKCSQHTPCVTPGAAPGPGTINLKQEAGPSRRTSLFHARSWSKCCPLSAPLYPRASPAHPSGTQPVCPHGDKAMTFSSTLPFQVRSCPGTSVGTRRAAPRIILPSRSSVVLQMWWDPQYALKTWCKQHMARTRQPWLAWPSRGQVWSLPSISMPITVYLWLKKFK